MKEDIDPIRAQFLMSPYNVVEAKRAREFRRTVATIVLVVTVLLIAGSIFAFFQR